MEALTFGYHLDDLPEMHLNHFPVAVFLMVKLMCFTAEGKVVKVGKESIHAIVLGFSSASIMSEDIREELKFNIV